MSVLENKIDFALVFSVKNANPNGDPLNGNIPRMTLDGHGELSDVCLKRKIRNRLLESGEKIFVQSDDYRKDEFRSLRNRAESVLKDVMKTKDEEIFRKQANETWFDVRSFGQVFAFKIAMCDNEVDRDFEVFPTETLEKLAELFVSLAPEIDAGMAVKAQAHVWSPRDSIVRVYVQLYCESAKDDAKLNALLEEIELEELSKS